MKLILLSGGSGKRLWPLSNNSRSKQFLPLLSDEDNNLQSMVQRVFKQLEKVGLQQSTIVATAKSQVDMIQNQLVQEVQLVIEPARRDTYPAIALASSYLYSELNTSLDETVVVLPVDPYVSDSYYEKLFELDALLSTSNADLALMGVKPTYPSEKYGYIVPKEKSTKSGYFNVDKFQEKPNEIHAKLLIELGALWNCGVFAFKLGFLLNILQEVGLPKAYDQLVTRYGELEKISFDYKVVENAKNVVATTYDGEWKDLGTWNTLTEVMNQATIGKALVSADCENSHVINELDIPVAVLGLSDVVVAASPDGILVTSKEASPRVKELIDFDQRPMFEERRWGWYRVLDHTRFDEGYEVLTKRIGVKAGKNLSYQYHFKRSEVWTVISGEGEFILDDKLFNVSAGSVLQIPVGAKHGIRAITDLEFIEVQTGTDLVEEDIVRLAMKWEETLEMVSTGK
jgi:mannose-1-phosphate guanylyltransferase